MYDRKHIPSSTLVPWNMCSPTGVNSITETIPPGILIKKTSCDKK